MPRQVNLERRAAADVDVEEIAAEAAGHLARVTEADAGAAGTTRAALEQHLGVTAKKKPMRTASH